MGHERYTISQGAIIIENDKVLLLERAEPPHVWLLPGGRADVGEDGETAFKREMKEELGLDDFKVLDVIDYDIYYSKDTNSPVSMISVLVKIDSSKIKLSDEHLQVKWIAEEELDNYNFQWRNAKRMITKGFQRHRELNT